MGMFDRKIGKPFADTFKDGQVFTLEDAKIGPEIPTQFGPGRPVQLLIGGEWYSAFGSGLTGQVEDMEDGDLPAEVKMARQSTKSGNTVKLLVPAATETTEDGRLPGAGDDIPF
jgi:hypothetical protein